VTDLEEISADDWQPAGIVCDAMQVLVGWQHTAEYLQEELQWELVQEVHLKQDAAVKCRNLVNHIAK